MENVSVTDKAILVDGAPDCFLTAIQALEHMDSWMNTPMDVNLDGDAYAEPEDKDYRDIQIINYDCTAWR